MQPSTLLAAGASALTDGSRRPLEQEELQRLAAPGLLEWQQFMHLVQQHVPGPP